MPKKPKRKTLVKKCDTMFSKVVRKERPYCVVCGSTERLTAGHLFSRSNYSTRWDFDNCETQCWGCNYRHEFDWEPFRAWYVKEYGQKKYDKVYKKHRAVRKWKDYELIELYKELKERYDS